jgi:hypothetical protein
MLEFLNPPHSFWRRLWFRKAQPAPRGSERQLRLFAVACCRRVQPEADEDGIQTALDMVERYADGAATEEDLLVTPCGASAHNSGLRADQLYLAMGSAKDPNWMYPQQWGPDSFAAHSALQAAAAYAIPPGEGEDWTVFEQRMADERVVQCALLRDIIGNPFRPAKIPPTCLEWSRRIVPQLAQSIYEEGSFEQMPILGDALEDAGCDEETILSHCRGPGTHIRGCWVLDLILARE